jgi:hypothetical protein
VARDLNTPTGPRIDNDKQRDDHTEDGARGLYNGRELVDGKVAGAYLPRDDGRSPARAAGGSRGTGTPEVYEACPSTWRAWSPSFAYEADLGDAAKRGAPAANSRACASASRDWCVEVEPGRWREVVGVSGSPRPRQSKPPS